MKIEFHPDALQEYEEAALWYATHYPSLGERFVDAIQSSLDAVADNPQAWPLIDNDVRRVLARVFPYAVLYSIETDYLLILAVMHCHQRPGYWRYRVMEPGASDVGEVHE